MNANIENNNWLRVSLYCAQNDWHKLLSDISILKNELSHDISNSIILFSKEKGENIRFAVSVTDSEKSGKLRNLISNHFTSFFSTNASASNKKFEYGKTLWCHFENNSLVWDTYDIATPTAVDTAYLSQTSNLIVELLEDDFSSDNFYSVSFYLFSKIMRSLAPPKRIDTIVEMIKLYSVEFGQFGEYDFTTSDLVSQFPVNLSDIFETIQFYWEEDKTENACLNEWENLAIDMMEKEHSPFLLIDNVFYILGLSLMERLFILEILHKWLCENHTVMLNR